MADKHKILIVEDDKYIINFISMSLKKEDYDYVIAKTCGEANALFYANRPDMIILDLGLPDGDGIEIIKNVREISKIPIIVVSARQEEEEKIQALDLGADDYVTKPFRPLELMARVKAQLRRYKTMTPKEEKNMVTIGALTIDQDNHQCILNNQTLSLTPTEFSILWLLCKHKGKVVTVDQIFQELWGEKYYTNSSSSIMVHIRHLREKMDDSAENPKYIQTVWGVGYKIG